MAFNPRQILIIVAAVIVVAAGGIYYYTSRTQDVVIRESADQATAKPPASAADALMAAGPLGEQALGDPNAPNIVVEYASMTCPHCERFHTDVFPQFKEKYIDTGKVYFIFREYPLDPLATSAIMLARCAPSDRYFPIVELLFDHQSSWAFAPDPLTPLQALLKQAGFTQASFNACLTNQEILDGVNWVKDRGANEFGVNSTPTFFFNGKKTVGAVSLAEIDRILGG